MKHWNWYAYTVIVIVGTIAGMLNKSFDNLLSALIFWVFNSNIFGFMFAYISRNENIEKS